VAEDVQPQADYGAGAQTQTQTFESTPTTSGSSSVEQAGDAAGGNVELMAAFERLRMLDEIGQVTVVRLQPGELPPKSADLESDKMTGVETSGTADAAAIESADSESAKVPSAEAGAEVDERIATGFEASGAQSDQAGADQYVTEQQAAAAETDLDSESAKMTGADTSADVVAETQVGAAEQAPSQTAPDDQTEAGALFSGSDQPQTGVETDSKQQLQADAGQQLPVDTSQAAGAVSATFIEDTINQIPEIKQALEENDAAAADIVSIDIDENGEVTIFVRQS
jgi:hypothetical protein